MFLPEAFINNRCLIDSVPPLFFFFFVTLNVVTFFHGFFVQVNLVINYDLPVKHTAEGTLDPSLIMKCTCIGLVGLDFLATKVKLLVHNS